MKDTAMAGDRAGTLIRVSSGGQDEQNQQPDVDRHTESHGYRVIKRYVLHDKSAFKGAQQETLDQIIADMREGVIKVLVVWHSDRIDRRELEYLLRFIRQVKEAGGRVESVKEGLLDGRNLNTIIAGYMNNEKSEHLSDQVQLAHSRIKDNKAFRGRDPFGYEITGPKYDKRLVVIESLRPVVAEIFDRVIAGQSLADVCTWLDSLEVKRSKTTTSKYQAGEVTPWWPAMLMRLVRHPAYSGRYYVKRTGDDGKTATYAHKCDPIVSRKTQQQAIEALAAREKRGPRGNPETRAMLKGVITCPLCEASPMYRITGRLGAGRQAYYRCFGRGAQRQGCGNLVKMDLADEAVDKIMAGTFDTPVRLYLLIKGNDWSDEIQVVKDEIAQLGAEDLADDEYDRRLKELRAERDRLQALPADDDEWREEDGDETYADAYAALPVHERGAWLKSHGFTVRADKTAVTVSQRDAAGGEVAWTEPLSTVTTSG
jgi:DNA invertase Pin-like site-specific DNA recombinase